MASYLVIFVVCALLQSALASAGGADSLGIYGGSEILIKDAPFMVVVYKHFANNIYKPVCGGTIINKWFILTAAHCLKKNDKAMVHMRTSYLYAGNKTKVVQIIRHKKFSSKTHDNDICLLKLGTRIQFGSLARPVKLPKKNIELETGTLVNVTGWGQTTSVTSGMAHMLRQATLRVVKRQGCQKYYPKLKSTQMCAGLIYRKFCKGDDGGPLTYNGVQVGIVSYYNGISYLNCSSYPGVYTKVASYLNWIKTKITENL